MMMEPEGEPCADGPVAQPVEALEPQDQVIRLGHAEAELVRAHARHRRCDSGTALAQLLYRLSNLTLE